MPDHRKSIHALISEYNEDREMYGAMFHHRDTGEDYQLLFPAWNEETNEKEAVYCLSAMTRLKFTMPFAEFKEKFVAGSRIALLEAEKARSAA